MIGLVPGTEQQEDSSHVWLPLDLSAYQALERLDSKENESSTHSGAGAPGSGSSEKPRKRIK